MATVIWVWLPVTLLRQFEANQTCSASVLKGTIQLGPDHLNYYTIE